MKKILMALAATTLVASPIVTAQAQAAQHREVVRTVHRGPQGAVVKKTVVRTDRHWRKGERFDSRYASRYTVINNPRTYRLYSPPRGYHWVRSGNDAVLVAIAGGVVGAVVANAMR